MQSHSWRRAHIQQQLLLLLFVCAPHCHASSIVTFFISCILTNWRTQRFVHCLNFAIHHWAETNIHRFAKSEFTSKCAKHNIGFAGWRERAKYEIVFQRAGAWVYKTVSCLKHVFPILFAVQYYLEYSILFKSVQAEIRFHSSLFKQKFNSVASI